MESMLSGVKGLRQTSPTVLTLSVKLAADPVWIFQHVFMFLYFEEN